MIFFALLLAAATSSGTLLVLPIEPQKSLSASDASALTAEIRAAAREALAPYGYSLADAAGPDPRAALEESGAAAVLFGRASQAEGATVVELGIYKRGSAAPAASARIVGIGLAQLKADARAKVPPLVQGALGLAPAPPERALPRGQLRLPGPSEPTPKASSPNANEAAPPRALAPPPPRDPNEPPLVALIREVTADVEQLRGLRRKRNLKVQILDDKLFSAAVREKAQKELTPASIAAERARWIAFDLAPPTADPASILLDVLDEQVAGFYDPFTKQLIVRKDPPDSAGPLGADGLRLVLAHEIEHALQDQNFGIPDLHALRDDDARLARSALFEGDAMAVMTAYAARRAHKPVKAAIASGAALLRSMDSETLLRVSGKSPALLKAPAILREELVLPYAAGFALVAEAYRRGGFPLVDRMFQKPPLTSHQVLHPQAYFAGENPLGLSPPAAPIGTRIVASGSMGEIGTRIALEACIDRAVVKDFAPQWMGDAYTIVEGPNRALTLLWTTAWSNDAASNVANLMKLLSPCWEDQSAARTEPASWTISAAWKLSASGDLVALARGSGALDSAVSRQLAAKPARPPAAPPLGNVPLPPAPEPVRIEGNRFLSSRLALEGKLPEGYEPDASNPLAELAIKRSGPGGGGASLSFVPESLAGDALETFFHTASTQLAAAQGAQLSLLGKAQRRLAGAAAEERVWSLEGSGLELRIEVAPFCGGRAALALVRVEGSDRARADLDRFATSIQPAGSAPACADLD